MPLLNLTVRKIFIVIPNVTVMLTKLLIG